MSTAPKSGFAALAFRPEAAPLASAMLLGAGLGGCFALSMIVALDHLSDPAEAGALSALMQGGGFLLTALPPWIVAVLHEATGSFVAGWLLHLISAVIFLVCYALLFKDPPLAGLVGWLAMLTRQTGHFFFEPSCTDDNQSARRRFAEK